VDANVERFRTEVKRFLDGWRSIDLRVIAFRFQDKWVYGAIRVVLSPDPPEMPNLTDLPIVNGLLVCHECWSIDRLDALLQSLSSGELQVGGETVIVVNENTSPPMSYTYQRLRPGDRYTATPSEYCTLYLQMWSGQGMIGADAEFIEMQLRTGEHPWDGVLDLLQNFIHASPLYASANPQRIVEVVAPIPVRIVQAILVEGSPAAVTVEAAPSVAINDVGLSLVGFVKNDRQIRVHLTYKSKADSTHYDFQVGVPESFSRAVAILTYRGLDVARIEQISKAQKGSNPRLVLLQSRGEDLDTFLASLREEKDKHFEERMSILFHILGLAPAHYGYLYQDNPDVFVFPDTNDWALDVECTEREIDLHDKVSKLATRTKVLRLALRGFKVHPLLVTKFGRVLINQTELDKAGTEGITVVTADEFGALIQMAVDGAKPMEVRDYILGLGPGEPSTVALR